MMDDIAFVVNVKEVLKEGELSALRVFEIMDGKVFEKEEFGTLEVENIKGEIQLRD